MRDSIEEGLGLGCRSMRAADIQVKMGECLMLTGPGHKTGLQSLWDVDVGVRGYGYRDSEKRVHTGSYVKGLKIQLQEKSML